MPGVPTTNSYNTHNADGVSTVFPFTFYAYSSAIIKVYTIEGDDDPVDVTGSVVISLNSTLLGGDVTITPALAAPKKVLIRREAPYTQEVEFSDLARYKETSIELGLNVLELQIQQLKDLAIAALKFQETSGITTGRITGAVDGAALVFDGVNGVMKPGPLVTEIANAQANAVAAAASAAAALVSQNAALVSENAAEAARDLAIAAKDLAEAAAVATAADAISTAADVVATNADAAATAADRVQTALDAVATAADRVQTALDRVATGADVVTSANNAALAAAAAGWKFIYSTTTTATDPGSGKVQFNHATLASATEMYISETTNLAQAIAAIIQSWDNSTNTVKSQLRMFKQSDPTVYAEFNITGTIVDNTDWDTATVAYVGGAGAFANNDVVTIQVIRVGDIGATGAAGPMTGRNIIIGGNFSTNPWQRGTTHAAANGYTADRWQFGTSSAAVVTVQKTADAPTVAQAGIFTEHCLHVDVTTADASVAAGDYALIGQVIEGYNWARIAQRPFVVSFWVKSSKTGTHAIAMRNNGADRSLVMEYTVNAANTWEYKSIACPAFPTSGGTNNYASAAGLQLWFSLMCGSTFACSTPNLGAWQSAGNLGSANQVNLMDSTSNDFKIQLVQVEEGTTPTAFEHRDVGLELDLCMRYYQKTFAQGSAPIQNFGVGGSLVNNANGTGTLAGVMIQWQYAVVMRGIPTCTTYNPSASNTSLRNATAGTDLAALPADMSDRSTLIINNGACIDNNLYRVHATLNAEI